MSEAEGKICRKSFYLIRHGETGPNRDKVISSVDQHPLSPQGLVQGMLMEELVNNLQPPPTKWFVGNSARTEETAIMMGKDEVKVVNGLRPLDYGKLGGTSYTKLFQISEAERISKGMQPESEHRVQVVQALNEELKDLDEKDVSLFVVTRGIISRVLESLGMDKTDNIENGAVFQFLPEGTKGWKVTRFAKTGEQKETIMISGESIPQREQSEGARSF